jgi:hypothetical protein
MRQSQSLGVHTSAAVVGFCLQYVDVETIVNVTLQKEQSCVLRKYGRPPRPLLLIAVLPISVKRIRVYMTNRSDETAPECSHLLNALNAKHYGVFRQSHKPAKCMSWDSAVGIATGHVLDDRAVRVRVTVGSRIFLSPRRLDRLWNPPSLLSNVYRWVQRPGREAGHSPTSAETKKMWFHTSTPPYSFMA